MTNESAIQNLTCLKIGFRVDRACLQEKDLAAALDCARHFGKKHGSPEEWNTHWHAHWDNLEKILHRIRALVNEMDASIARIDSDCIKNALAAWETFLIEDATLVEALGAIRARASGLNAAARKDWNLLACTLDSHLDSIYACAQALRVKLELLKKHSREDVDRIFQSIDSKIQNRPHTAAMDAAFYEREYLHAAAELDQERHENTGFMDFAKALLMWVETTGERVTRNRSLRIEET